MRAIGIATKGMPGKRIRDIETLINLGYEQKDSATLFDYIVVTSEKEIYTTNMQPQNFLLQKFGGTVPYIDVVVVNSLISFIELETTFLLHKPINIICYKKPVKQKQRERIYNELQKLGFNPLNDEYMVDDVIIATKSRLYFTMAEDVFEKYEKQDYIKIANNLKEFIWYAKNIERLINK